MNSKCAPICVSTCCCHQVCFVQVTMSFRNHWDTPTVIWASPPVNVNTMKNIKTSASPQTAEQTRWQLPLTAPTHSVKACQRYSTRGPGINMDKMGGGGDATKWPPQWTKNGKCLNNCKNGCRSIYPGSMDSATSIAWSAAGFRCSFSQTTDHASAGSRQKWFW